MICCMRVKVIQNWTTSTYEVKENKDGSGPTCLPLIGQASPYDRNSRIFHIQDCCGHGTMSRYPFPEIEMAKKCRNLSKTQSWWDTPNLGIQ